VSAGATGRILLPFYPAYVRGKEKAVTVAANLDNSQQVRQGRTSFSEETEGIWQKREL